MTRFTLKHLLAFTMLVALLSTYVASVHWFGASKLRLVDFNERLLSEDNEMIEADIFYSIPLQDHKISHPNVRYKCPYCSNETRVPLSGISEFSTKDLSRFKNFTGISSPVVYDYDVYCIGCNRPVRITAEATVLLIMTADGHGRVRGSFLQVVESEF